MVDEVATEETPAEGTAPDSLLDTATPELADGEWFQSDGIKGVGDKPEWFNSEKFKTVAEQAKGHQEIHKKMGAFTGSPKDGYSAPEGIEKDDELLVQLTAFADEAHMSQDGFNKAWDLLTAQSQAVEETSVESEMAKLGDNAQQRIKNVEGYLKNATGDSYENIMPLVNDANSVELVERIMKATAPVKLPIDGGESPSGMTWADIEKEMFRKDDNGQLLRSVNREHSLKIDRMMAEFGGKKQDVAIIG